MVTFGKNLAASSAHTSTAGEQADADGYSRVMEADEVGTLGALRAARTVFSRFIERHHGRIANTAGDGLIYHTFERYAPRVNAVIGGRHNGVLVSMASGKALAKMHQFIVRSQALAAP